MIIVSENLLSVLAVRATQGDSSWGIRMPWYNEPMYLQWEIICTSAPLEGASNRGAPQ